MDAAIIFITRYSTEIHTYIHAYIYKTSTIHTETLFQQSPFKSLALLYIYYV